ncbi:MAG: hypothetical protein CVV27_19610, partial [Candidatus Melainabacteria bacterium HGW-Melainabacteria-1]
MLNQNICLVDFSEQSYSIKQLYTQSMPRPQLNLLYLATALGVRPNQVTLLSQRDDASQDPQIRLGPLPADPERFWAEAGFDVVVCLDSLAGVSEIRPYLPAQTPLVLWSHLPPRHVAMMPLQHADVREAFAAFVFESFYLVKSYHELYQLPAKRCHYRWPAMVRSLRNRFSRSDQLAAVREPGLTMAFTAHPAYGLSQTLDMFEQFKQTYPELRLRVLTKPGFEPEIAGASVIETLQRCRETADVELLAPMPWPSQVEKLLGCQVLCHPLAFQDLGCSELIDPLAAGCLTVLSEHPGLREIVAEQSVWI